MAVVQSRKPKGAPGATGGQFVSTVRASSLETVASLEQVVAELASGQDSHAGSPGQSVEVGEAWEVATEAAKRSGRLQEWNDAMRWGLRPGMDWPTKLRVSKIIGAVVVRDLIDEEQFRVLTAPYRL